MIYKIEITPAAKADLKNIYEYIAFSLLAPQSAAGQLDKLEKGIMSLDQMPMRFKAYGAEPWHSRGLRIMTVDKYAVLYIPNEETGIVTVIRVMYGGRNIDEQLDLHTEY